MSALLAPVPLYGQAEGVWKRGSDVRERVETIYSHDAMKAMSTKGIALYTSTQQRQWHPWLDSVDFGCLACWC